METEDRLQYKTNCLIPTINGDFQLHLFAEQTKDGEIKEHLALVMGEIQDQVNTLVRIHSECCTGDIFGCQRCDCQDQLNVALDMIRRKKQGILLYLRQEGRGVGLENKLNAYNLQDRGLDTVEANHALGFESDYRKYDIAAEMLNYLGVNNIELISNNTNKVKGVEEYGIHVARRIAIVINSPIKDRTDLFNTKQKKLGHVFDKLDSISIIEDEDQYQLVLPSLFMKNTAIPEVSRHNTETIKNKLLEKFGESLTCLLFQGSNMRGDGSLQDSDFDYICIFKNLSSKVIEVLSEIKNELPRNNFLYLSEEEYQMYPNDSKLQFFITRKVHGDFDLGNPPSRKDILATAVKYAIQLKDIIRPLLFEFINDPTNKSLLTQAHTAIKRVDDCFLRVMHLYINGKYPLHREHLKNSIKGESIKQITDIIDVWYAGNVTVREICESLRTADRLINLFLRMTLRNKF